MFNFTQEALLHIITTLQEKLKTLSPKDIIEFEVINPDLFSSTYSGNIVDIDNNVVGEHG